MKVFEKKFEGEGGGGGWERGGFGGALGECLRGGDLSGAGHRDWAF